LKHPDAEAEFAPKESMKTRPNLGLAIVGGFVGTPAMTVTVYLLATLIGVKMNFVDALATMLGGWKMGMLVHVLNGANIFPLGLRGLALSFFPGSGLREGADLWANAMAGFATLDSASDWSGVVQFSNGWDQGLGDVIARSSSLRSLAGFVGRQRH
jgi:hypothetical protein